MSGIRLAKIIRMISSRSSKLRAILLLEVFISIRSFSSVSFQSLFLKASKSASLLLSDVGTLRSVPAINFSKALRFVAKCNSIFFNKNKGLNGIWKSCAANSAGFTRRSMDLFGVAAPNGAVCGLLPGQRRAIRIQKHARLLSTEVLNECPHLCDGFFRSTELNHARFK